MNPGAAGNQGYHKVATALRFIIDSKEIKRLDIFELDRKKYRTIFLGFIAYTAIIT